MSDFQPPVVWRPAVNSIYQMEARQLLQQMPDRSVDLIVTDPPYGKGYKAGYRLMNNNRKQRQTSADFGTDVFDASWLLDAYRVLKDDTALYLFTQWDVIHLWREAVKQAGFRYAMVIVWNKLNWGGGNLGIYGCQTEFIMLCTKGSHAVSGPRSGNVWALTKMDVINYEGNLDNPTQKPERLLRRPIEYSSKPGGLVVDPFIGTGTTAAAARTLNRNYIGSDISEYQVVMARNRLAQPAQTDFFASV